MVLSLVTWGVFYYTEQLVFVLEADLGLNVVYFRQFAPENVVLMFLR